MKKIIYTGISCFFAMGLLSPADVGLANQALPTVSKNLQEPESFKGENLHVATLQAKAPLDFTAAVGLISLAALREFSTIELVWWRSESSKIRMLCVSLIVYGVKDNEIKLETLKDLERRSGRFDLKEKNARLKEIELFNGKRKEFDVVFKRIKKLTSKIKSDNR